MIVLRFPAEGILFAVDFVGADRLPYRDFPDAYLDEWPATVRALERLDFKILATAHGAMGKKAHVASGRVYLEELRAAVEEQLRQGRSLDEIKRRVTMDKYRGWARYADWRELNVEGMVRHLQNR